MKTEAILNLLDKVAEANPVVSSARLAAAIVYKNDIISLGINQRKTHPFQRRFAKHEMAIFLHAEIDAIKNALKHITIEELSKSKLYISRVKYDDSERNPTPDKLRRGLARPCAGCARAIATFNIQHVCFTTEEGYEIL